MKTISLPCYGITIIVNNGGGTLVSDLKKDEENQKICAMYDGLESLILAHACAGVDIETPAYLEGIETAVEAIYNNTYWNNWNKVAKRRKKKA